jgi:hypothetical protein
MFKFEWIEANEQGRSLGYAFYCWVEDRLYLMVKPNGGWAVNDLDNFAPIVRGVAPSVNIAKLRCEHYVLQILSDEKEDMLYERI